VRTKGRYTINMNYTYGKSMGIVNPALDQFNLNNDYGVLAANRKQISTSLTPWNWGNPIKGNKFAGGAVNGWNCLASRNGNPAQTSPPFKAKTSVLP